MSGGSETRKRRSGRARRVGAPELKRRRSAVRLRVAGIGRDVRRDLVRQPHHGIEVRKAVVAIKAGAEVVVELDAGRR